MRMRNRFLVAVIGFMALSGCDDRQPSPTDILSKQAGKTSAPTTAPAPANPLAGPFKPLPLGFIPFVAEAPESWSVKPDDLLGRIGLHGKLTNGEIDAPFASRKVVNADTFASLLADFQRTTTGPSGVTTKVVTRDKLTIVERVELFGQPDQSPADRLVGYSVKYFVQGTSNDYEVYELNVADLSKEMYDLDAELIRKVLLGFKYDPKAMEQTP